MKMKRAVRLTVVALLLCLCVSMFTGCGFVLPGDDYSQNNLCYNKNDEPYSENSVIKWFVAVKNSDLIVSRTGLGGWGTNYQPYTQQNGKNYGIFFIRQIAIFMHNSCFSPNPGGGSNLQYDTADADVFAGRDHLETMNLQPVDLIKKVNSITMGSSGINLRGNSQSTGRGLDGIGSIITSIKGISIAILIAVWAMGFISQIVNEKFTPETLLKTFMQLMCGIVITINAEFIVSTFAAAGNAMVDNYQNSTNVNNSFSAFSDSCVKALHGGVLVINFGINFLFHAAIGSLWLDWGSLLTIVYMLPPLVTIVICAYKIVSQMIMRMLELLVRVIFAPIPIAFSVQNGFSQEAIRYFRGVLACALQPVFMIVGCICVPTIATVVAKIFSDSASASTLSGFVGSFGMAIAYLVLSSYLGETKRLAQEIIAR